MKHTPHPWYWTKKYPTIDGRETWTLVSDAPGKHGILSCDGEHNSPEPADRNLIEAAPDLLAACKAVLKECHISENHGEPPTAEMAADVLDVLRAAIRKAEGGAL